MNKKIMGNSKSLLFAVLALAGVTFSATSFAEKTNFSHTILGIDVGSSTYKIPPCIVGYCVDKMGAASLGGSIQFADDLLVANISSTGLSYSNPVWNAEISGSSLGLGIVKAIGDKVDVLAGVESLSVRTQICTAGGVCVISDDTGTGYGAGLTIGINDTKTLVARVSITSTKYSKSTTSTQTTGLGLGYYVSKNSEISGSYASNDVASSTTVGYTYHF